MPFTPYTIDDSITRVSGGSILVTEGEYRLEVVSVEASPEDHNGEPFYRWTLSIDAGPDGIGRSFRHTTTMKADGQWGLGTLLNALGQMQFAASLKGRAVATYAQHQEMAAVLGKLKGQKVGALVITGSYNGKERSEINEFYPAADYEKRKVSNLLPRPTAPAPLQVPGGNGAVAQAAQQGAVEPTSFADLDKFFAAPTTAGSVAELPF